MFAAYIPIMLAHVWSLQKKKKNMLVKSTNPAIIHQASPCFEASSPLFVDPIELNFMDLMRFNPHGGLNPDNPHCSDYEFWLRRKTEDFASNRSDNLCELPISLASLPQSAPRKCCA